MRDMNCYAIKIDMVDASKNNSDIVWLQTQMFQFSKNNPNIYVILTILEIIESRVKVFILMSHSVCL